MRRRQPENHGFTLIELSIVLVVIGLIVGGVLVGQDLVSAAAARAQIAQIEKFNTAVNTFQNKFGGLPGDLDVPDATNFGFNVPSTCTGQQGGRDGNGLIDGYPSITIYRGLMGENALFWEDLSTANMIDAYGTPQWSAGNSNVCAYSVSAPQTAVGNYIPPGKIGYGTYVHVYEAKGSNWFMLANIPSFSAATSTITANPTIPVIQAANIDKKIDDGLPMTGAVNTVYINAAASATTTAPSGNPDTTSTCYNNSTNAYSTNISNGSGLNCALSFKMQGAAR